MLSAKTAAEVTEAVNNELLNDRMNMDGVPPVVNLSNKDEFVQLYCYNSMMKAKPFLDQFMCGLNHAGVSCVHFE